MEKRCGGPSPFTRTVEFGEAMITYGKVLQACKVPPKDVQRQLVEFQSPMVTKERVAGFIDLTRELQKAPLLSVGNR